MEARMINGAASCQPPPLGKKVKDIAKLKVQAGLVSPALVSKRGKLE